VTDPILRQTDPILRQWVHMLNKSEENELSLTVIVGGIVISGLGISATRYLNETARRIAEALGSDESVEMKLEDDDIDADTHLHILDAKIFVQARPTIFPLPLRLRLDAIDGFMLGA